MDLWCRHNKEETYKWTQLKRKAKKITDHLKHTRFLKRNKEKLTRKFK